MAPGPGRNRGEDRQISQALKVLGDPRRLARFQRRAMRQRAPRAASTPASRSTPPPQPAVDWSSQQRLTRLAPTPTKNTAFYIYDWLIGLQTPLAENATTESAFGEVQRGVGRDRGDSRISGGSGSNRGEQDKSGVADYADE
ncbi:hypothetical protein M8494_31045 [Serratia ureilytica]